MRPTNMGADTHAHKHVKQTTWGEKTNTAMQTTAQNPTKKWSPSNLLVAAVVIRQHDHVHDVHNTVGQGDVGLDDQGVAIDDNLTKDLLEEQGLAFDGLQQAVVGQLALQDCGGRPNEPT